MPNPIRLSVASLALGLLACARLNAGGAATDAGAEAADDDGAMVPTDEDAAGDVVTDAAADAVEDGAPDAPGMPSTGEAGLPDAGDGGGLSPLPAMSTTWLSQVIYLVIVDRFSNGDPSNDSAVPGCFDPTNPLAIHGGDFAGLRARIPYLVDLGVTAVWMTPVQRQSVDRCGYHGYWPDYVDPDDGAIAPNLGTPDDLAALVADLHAHNIRVIFDIVLNQTGVQARIVTQHPDWFHAPATCSALGDPTIYCPIGEAPLPDFAQEDPTVAAYLSSLSTHLATRFGIDGARMDSVKNIYPQYWQSSWFPTVRPAAPTLFVIGEDFDQSGASALLPFVEDGFDSLFDYPRYAQIVTTFAQGGSVDRVASAVADANTTYGLSRALQMVAFADNHDRPRLTTLVSAASTDAGIADGGIADGGIADGGIADADRVAMFRLSLAATFTLPGIPQLMWGDELALLGGADPDNRHDMPAWAWTPASRAGTHPGSVGDGQAQYAYTQKLIATRSRHTALTQGSFTELWRQNGGTANLFGFFRGSANDRVIVAINAGAAATVSMQIAGSHLGATDKAALADGTVLAEVLGAGAPGSATVAGGLLPLAMPAETVGIYVVP
jgi:glycosidase